jgi:phospholipase C
MKFRLRSIIKGLGIGSSIFALSAFLYSSWCSPGASSAPGSIRDVEHIVILMQENSSFDHYFGSLNGVRGFDDGDPLLLPSGRNVFFQPSSSPSPYVLPYRTTAPCLKDVEHTWGATHSIRDSGRWDNWVKINGASSMAFYGREELGLYYALADAYTVCDANFCSVMGPTFPNRLYLFTGMIDPASTGGGPSIDNSVPRGGFAWTTYPERLQAAGIDWKVYTPKTDDFGGALAWFARYRSAVPGTPLFDRGMARVEDVVSAFSQDISQGTLPKVSWIIPPLALSEHPPHSAANGQNFVKRLLDAIASDAEIYDSTVFILTYDEGGGFFDHVAPPVPPPGTAGEYVHGRPIGLGVRVPMILVSPWTRGGCRCSEIFDHTSIIRFLEKCTGVLEPNISEWRRRTCGDLSSAFDFTNLRRDYPSLPGINPISAASVRPAPPTRQAMPRQEPGSKIARP